MPVIPLRFVRAASRTVLFCLLLLLALVMTMPLAWTVLTSLKDYTQITSGFEGQWLPNPIMWGNYVDVFQVAPLTLYLRNTFFTVTLSVLGATVVCSLVAYAFAKIPFPGRNALFAVLLSTMMMPWIVSMIPLFISFDRLGWVPSFLPLVIPRLLAHDPFYIFLLRQFFRGIPNELFDAARIDGCSEFGIWRRIVIPSSTPVLAVVTMFSFQHAWNDFMAPLIYLGGDRTLWTLMLGLFNFRSFEGRQDQLHYLMVLSVLLTLPMLLVVAQTQRRFVSSAFFSGIKG